MRYRVIECHVSVLQKELNKLKATERVVACNYIGSLENQIIVECTGVKINEAKTMGKLNGKLSNKNKK